MSGKTSWHIVQPSFVIYIGKVHGVYLYGREELLSGMRASRVVLKELLYISSNPDFYLEMR